MKYTIVPVTPLQQNCTVLWCGETMLGAVVDPGGDVDRIAAVVERSGARIERILLTHGHFDHAGGVLDLAERFGVPVDGPHREDEFLLERLREDAAMFGLQARGPVRPDRWLDQGDVVTVGRIEFAVHHCPGHTPGHVIFHHAPSRLALVGDVLFRGSVGRTDLPRGSHETLIRSIRERLLPLGDETAFIPGHGPTSSIGLERLTNPFLRN